MYTYLFLGLILLASPAVAQAQNTGSLQSYLTNILGFIDGTLIPFLFAIAFLFFVVNVIRFFVAGAGNEDSREKAKSVAIYSIAAFVFLVVFNGLVNLLVGSTGLEGKKQPIPDYIERNGSLPSDCPIGSVGPC